MMLTDYPTAITPRPRYRRMVGKSLDFEIGVGGGGPLDHYNSSNADVRSTENAVRSLACSSSRVVAFNFVGVANC